MSLKKDGTPDKRTGSVMARKPKKNHAWMRPFSPYTSARKRAKESGFKESLSVIHSESAETIG